MAKKFLSKKIIIPAIIFFGGLFIAAGVLFLPSILDIAPMAAGQIPQWTQQTGAGLSAPACASMASPPVTTTCNGGIAEATISWIDYYEHDEGVNLDVCKGSWCPLIVYTPAGMYNGSGWDTFSLPAAGSVTLTPLESNTTYLYALRSINTETGVVTVAAAYPDFTTPNCAPPPPGDFNLSLGGGLACNSVPLSWTTSSNADGYRILKGAARVDITPYNPYTALNFTDTSAVQNTDYKYQIEAYNESGDERSNTLNITTPYCPPSLNFSGDPTTIYEGQSSTLTWSSTYTTSCVASGAWSGSKSLNDSQVVIPLPPPSVTYTLTCTGLGGSTGPQSVIINVTPLGLPNWKEIIPR